jgi:putative oxidoreductase
VGELPDRIGNEHGQNMDEMKEAALMDAGLFILRAAVGVIFMAHGAQKLFGWFGGHGLQGTAGWLESMNLRPGKVFAGINGIVEFGAGALLLLGFLTPLAAAAVVGVMLVATALVHWPKGFFSTNGGFEFNLALAAGALALVFTGPGSFALDSVLDLDLAGVSWGLAAFAIGILSAGLVLGVRRLEGRAPHPTAV